MQYRKHFLPGACLIIKVGIETTKCKCKFIKLRLPADPDHI